MYIICVTGVVFVASFMLFFESAKRVVISEAFSHANSEVAKTSSQIVAALTQVEQSVKNAVLFVESNLARPDSLIVIITNMLQANPLIDGASIAFEPGYYPSKGTYFMPYVHREGMEIRAKILGSVLYDYFYMDWYLIPKLLKQDYWSEPYYDEGGGEMIMTTYTHRLTGADGELYGVVTADVKLDRFTTLVNATKPYARSHTFMLSRNGYYLSHCEPEKVLNETIFSPTVVGEADTMAVYIGRQMMSGAQGIAAWTDKGAPAYVFHAPIHNTRWSIATVIPDSDVLEGLYTMTWTVATAALAGILLLFGFTTIVIRKVSAPLRSFSQSVRMVASGNFDVPLPSVSSKDELGELHHAFQFMQSSLKNYIGELKETTAKKQQIESELQIARTIQMGMVPKIFPPFPKRSDIDLFAVLNPAKEVGGDLYDFFVVDNRLYFTIGDVSGKGVPASLLMAVTRSLFRSASSHIDHPSGIVKSINNSISETNDAGMFVTLFVGIIDLATGHFSYCNAGHNPPVIIVMPGYVNFMELKTNIVVGIFDGYNYEGGECFLNCGDTIFLYTDGVTEAQSRQWKLYGEARLIEALKANAGDDPKTLIHKIIDDVAVHVHDAEPSDDLTILAIQYKAARQRETITIRNRITDIPSLASWIELLAKHWSIGREMEADLQLAVEEAVVNVISYAYPENETGAIDIALEMTDGALIVEITDSGIAFDPTGVPQADVTLPVDERPIGGLGLFLISHVVDSVTYRRQEGKNILEIRMNSRV
ncbi:MAG: SpoIIE family protein phosphatase [Tannerellaceae bacterium]|nr:SpoIIE family protein phosphatase [Tannerellaceae bacterium]